MRLSPLVLQQLALGLVASWITAASADPVDSPRYVLTDREAFVLQRPVLVAQPPVAAAEWSFNGRYVLLARQTRPVAEGQAPTGEISLVLWNGQTGRASEIGKPLPGIQTVKQISWLPHTSMALVVVRGVPVASERLKPDNALLRIDASRRELSPLGQLQLSELLVSPEQPLAVLLDRDANSLRVIQAEGSIGPVVRLPVHAERPSWSLDGNTLYLLSAERPPMPGQPAVSRWRAFNPRTGQIRTLLEGPPDLYQARPLPVRLKSSVATLKEENSLQRIQPLWLESAAKSAPSRVLVCADSEWSRLAPTADAVLYLSQGGAWVAPLVPASREQMLARSRVVDHTEVVSHAQQIGEAFAMYAQDHDQQYPPAGERALDDVKPYIKHDAVLFSAPGFVYVLDAVRLGAIKDPASKILGYLPGPGGRALVYADGHIEWKDDQGPPRQ
jgi:hypothetical protein